MKNSEKERDRKKEKKKKILNETRKRNKQKI